MAVVLPKSVEAVAALFGIMKAGAAYVPVDYSAPIERSRRIVTDCQVRALILGSATLGIVPDGPGAAPVAVVVVGARVEGASEAFKRRPSKPCSSARISPSRVRGARATWRTFCTHPDRRASQRA